MSPDNPFLAALIAQPDDDTFRLAMADWFIDNDQPARAEFIRVQVELAAGVADPDRRRELEVRQRDLLIAHDAEWVRPLAGVLGCRPGEWGGWVFRRGFAEYFRLPAGVLLDRGADLANLTPVRELNLEWSDDWAVVALCRQPWMRSVTHLYNLPLNDPVTEALLASPHLSGLRHLPGPLTNLSRGVLRRLRERFAAALRPDA